MATSRAIPIEHTPTFCEVVPEPTQPLPPLTLLELIRAVDEVSDSQAEVLATVQYMMESGRIKLAPCALDAADSLAEAIALHQPLG